MNAPLPLAALPAPKQPFELKKLNAKHKRIAALLAQGLGRTDIGNATGVTPEYVTMLSKQTIFQDYIKEMTGFVDTQLHALFGKSVEVLADVMLSGREDTRLRAAQMVMRAVGKEGSVKVQGTVHHKHSLVGILQGLPPAGSPANNVVRDVPIWNAPDSKDVVGLNK